MAWRDRRRRPCNVPDEARVAFASAVVVNDHLQEIGSLRKIVVTPRGAENRVERVDVFDMEADLEVLADGFHRGVDLSQDLVFGFVEEAIPKDDFRILDEPSPELDEVAVARPLVFERPLYELIKFGVSVAGTVEVDAPFARGPLMVLAEAGHAR